MAIDRSVPNVEILRWWAALSGVLLWFTYIWVVRAGLEPRAQQYCAVKEAVGETCVYDYIPVIEAGLIPIFVFAVAYFFARFAFGIYAPPRQSRRLHWSFAGGIEAAGAYPVLQILAGLGLCWSVFRLSVLPFAFISWLVILYWIAWIVWFAVAIVISWPRRNADNP